jgi:transposase InsO family protein
MKTMPNSTQEERYRWIKPILDGDITIKAMAKVCPFSLRALKYWLASYYAGGIEGLIPKSTKPKSHPQETPIRIKERVIEIRKETHLSALKLHWKLEKENISIHERTIGKIIKKEKLTRKYRIRKIQYKYIKAQFLPGEMVEIDVKYVPEKLNFRRYYQFTAIDCATRWRYLKIYDEQTNTNAIHFLEELMKLAPFPIQAVKTDNGFIFTNRYTGYQKSQDPYRPRLHGFDILCQELGVEHYLIDPGKPAQNGKVERSHRSDQEMFYDRNKFKNVEELKYKIRLWNMCYNDLEHCGLNGLTPNQALKLQVQYVCS